ncbi:phosphopentomutase [Clostridium sp. E02]|uniref:phosphopentomutase n=1 Tax=Clostridium sp. E02 TaxID=2487134 RepID=UPI000F53E73B|nr:phosphopentomutase [Clostridium sp. E02]
MTETKRVFLIVLDSFGIGEAPDANKFHDEGSNTLGSIAKEKEYHTPNLKKLGMFNIDGVTVFEKEKEPIGSYGRMTERSQGKDTTIGHWEIAGIISEDPLPTYPQGFPEEVLREFKKQTGRGILCNKPYSGTDVIRDYGNQHMETGDLIVYTSADSVFQIAAHEDVVPLEELYRDCRIAREILKGEHGVGRVIARPFLGKGPEDFKRTPHRHDFSLLPPKKTMLDCLEEAGFDTIGVGKIYDIFAGKGIQRTMTIVNNTDGMEKTLLTQQEDFRGICFVNLVDFDMLYGHRNDVKGYARAATEFDVQLGDFLKAMRPDDVLIITADHGCDPGTPSTDHSREYTPMLIYGEGIKKGVSIGTRDTFADIAATVLDLFGIKGDIAGKSYLKDVEE